MEIRKIDYDFTAEDAVAFARYAADHDPNGRKIPRTRPWAWACLVVFVVAGVTSIWVEDGPRLQAEWAQQEPEPFSLIEWAKALIIPTVIVVSMLLYFFRNPLRAYWVRRRYRNPDTARWLGRHSLSFSPDTLTITTPLSSSTLKWEIVYRIAVTKDHTFLMLNRKAAHVLPRRAFLDKNDYLDFVEAMERYHASALRNKGEVKKPLAVPDNSLTPGQRDTEVGIKKQYEKD